jgi:GH15 family glucan-1,4-alpha-glucosidase
MYQAIENYGVIGNMRTAALISREGSLDWMCAPHFDSPSVFAAILDEHKGGRFLVEMRGSDLTHRQSYWPDTNVLVTRFLAREGVGEVTDYMAVGASLAQGRRAPLVRRLNASRGNVTFHVLCEPAFNYARDPHETRLIAGRALFVSQRAALGLSGPVPFQRTAHGCECEVTLREGESAAFVLEMPSENRPPAPFTAEEERELFHQTIVFWRHWIARCTYTGRWREVVQRSALLLKLLTFEPTGAIIASPTASLPEEISGERNWDYRFTWIRDAAFIIYGLIRIGFTEEAAAFMRWLQSRACEREASGELQIVYGIDGRHDLREETLDHLEGYRKSRPVRIGNDAFRQLQLDIYGELMDSVYLFNKYGSPISYELWQELRRLITYVCDHWTEKDEGIWEVRSGREHFVYSKLMCWVALDRGLRLADKRSFPGDRARWLQVRDEIYETIMEQGWNKEREAFVQSFGSTVLDASNLIMPLVFFMAPTDPRMLTTLTALDRSPAQGGLVADSLVYRYNRPCGADGLRGREGTFNMCTFWLVEALTRAAPNRAALEQPRVIFERMLSYANHLGLYGEQIGMSGETLGNFPQGFTHLALISAAFNLDRRLGARS